MEFKPGDKVVYLGQFRRGRICQPKPAKNQTPRVVIGNTYVVRKVIGKSGVYLDGVYGVYVPESFEIVKSEG